MLEWARVKKRAKSRLVIDFQYYRLIVDFPGARQKKRAKSRLVIDFQYHRLVVDFQGARQKKKGQKSAGYRFSVLAAGYRFSVLLISSNRGTGRTNQGAGLGLSRS